MTRKLIFTSVLAVAALSLAVGAAGAQDRDRNGQRHASGRATQAREGRAQRREAPAQVAPRSTERRQQAADRAVPRGNAGRPYPAPPAEPRTSENRSSSAAQGAPRAYAIRPYNAPQAAPRADENRSSAAPRDQARGNGNPQYSSGRAVPRQYNGGGAPPRPDAAYGRPNDRYDDHRGYGQPRGGQGYYGSRAYVIPRDFHPYRPYYFSRPYYGFRPHVHIGFGVWLGVSVPYPWTYFGAYRPRVYGYYSRDSYGVALGMYQYGGLSFDIQPYDAGLFVDGEYVGTVGTFTPYGEPLTLWPGVHHIAIVCDGFRTMEWDVTVQPGQVIPYRGMLSRW